MFRRFRTIEPSFFKTKSGDTSLSLRWSSSSLELELILPCEVKLFDRDTYAMYYQGQ